MRPVNKLCTKKTYIRLPHLHLQSVAYPAVNLYVDSVKIAVGSADIDELNQRSNTDALWRREGKITDSKELRKRLKTFKIPNYFQNIGH